MTKRTDRKEFSTTLSADERAILDAHSDGKPGRAIRACTLALEAGDVANWDKHLAAVDAETALTRSGSGRIGGFVKHHGPDAKKMLPSASTRASDADAPGKTQDKPRRNTRKKKK